jgi:hypothetical protein
VGLESIPIVIVLPTLDYAVVYFELGIGIVVFFVSKSTAATERCCAASWLNDEG